MEFQRYCVLPLSSRDPATNMSANMCYHLSQPSLRSKKTGNFALSTPARRACTHRLGCFPSRSLSTYRLFPRVLRIPPAHLRSLPSIFWDASRLILEEQQRTKNDRFDNSFVLIPSLEPFCVIFWSAISSPCQVSYGLSVHSCKEFCCFNIKTKETILRIF